MQTSSLDTGTTDLLAERVGPSGGILVITLNRPDRRNALSLAMLNALGQMIDLGYSDASVRCVVLTGNGGAFCAGGDVKDMAAGPGGSNTFSGTTLDQQLNQQREAERATVARLYRMPKPVLAALPGPAAGAGMGLCMACDLRVATSNTVMTTAFVKVGLSGDFGLPWLLTQQLGRAKALELFYLSDKLNAEQCLALGLVNRVVPEENLRATTLELAAQLANGPSVALGLIKENMNAAGQLPLEQFLDGEVMRHLTAMQTEDHREAARAFVERRLPRFSGR